MRSRKKPEREVDEDLVTRTSWVNAELAYKHVKKVSQQPSPSPTRVRGNLALRGHPHTDKVSIQSIKSKIGNIFLHFVQNILNIGKISFIITTDNTHVLRWGAQVKRKKCSVLWRKNAKI